MQECWDNNMFFEERTMILFLGQRDGTYQKMDHTLEIYNSSAGGTRGGSYRNIWIVNGYLLYRASGGSRSGWYTTQYYQ